MNVHIATSRPQEIGRRCQRWAAENLPDGFMLVSEPEECDIFVSVLYDTLVTKEFIASRRCYNFHPGILPDYRGSGVYSWVLINKEAETGVTLHEIDCTIDTGPIIDVAKTQITQYDTAMTLFNRSMGLLFALFTSYFHRILWCDYRTQPNEGGWLYLRSDLEDAKDVSHIVRAFTFDDKESVYWKDQQGKKRYIEWDPESR